MIAQIWAMLAATSGLTLVTEAEAKPRPVVIGYAPAFKELEHSLRRKDIAGYSHINIAFANPDRRGLLAEGGSLTCMPDAKGGMLRLEQLRAAAAGLRAGGAKVLVSLAGGVVPGCSGDWAALLAPSRRAATVANLARLVDEADLDGLDIDLEGTLLTAIDEAGDYTPFVAALSQELKRRGKLLTCATGSCEGGMIPADSIPYFDFVNVMSYDGIGATWGEPGSEHAPYAAAERDLALWRARGVAKDRLVLGVPFYGYGFGRERPNWTYRELSARNPAEAATGDMIGNLCAGCSYITFNGRATIARKAKLAAEQARGVMVWEVTQDTDDGVLLKAIRRALRLERLPASRPARKRR